MKIPKEKLGQFGISIKVNRKERLRKYSGASWTQKGFCDGICSEPSFVNIEKGKPGRFIDNYEKMAEKLGMRIAYDPDVDKKIDNYTKHLYKAIEYYDLKKTEKYCDKLIALLEGFKDCLWYGDLYRVVVATRNYYILQIHLNTEERTLYANMVDEFCELWNEILKSTVYNAAFNDVESLDYIMYFEKFKIYDGKSAINIGNTMMYYLARENTSKFRDLYDKAVRDWKKKRNYIRLIDAYNMALLFLSYYDVSEVDEVAEKVNNIISEIDVPIYKLVDVYYNLSAVYYELKQFEKSIEFMEKCYHIDSSKIKCTFLIIGSALHCKGQKSLIPFYTNSELSNFPVDAKLLYEYFTMDDDVPAMTKENFLMKQILPEVNEEDDLCLKIIKNELEILIKETRKYKDLKILEEKSKQLLKETSEK